MTVRVHTDRPVAGAGFSSATTGDSMVFWAAFGAWLRHLPRLNAIRGLMTAWILTDEQFSLEYGALPDSETTTEVQAALEPSFSDFAKLDI